MNIIKAFKPVTPGTRHRVRVNRGYKVPMKKLGNSAAAAVNNNTITTESSTMVRYLWKKRPEKSLLGGLCGNKAGRNNEGRITVYNRSGARRLYRYIDFKRSNINIGTIERFEYDPNRTAFIALLRSNTNTSTVTAAASNASSVANNISYILATADTKVGDQVVSMGNSNAVFTAPAATANIDSMVATDNILTNDQSENTSLADAMLADAQGLLANKDINTSESSSAILTVGNAYCLKNIPVGKDIHSIAGKYVRTAGATAKLIKKTINSAIVRLPSGKLMEFSLDNIATLGIVSNIDHKNEVIGKAGTNRLRGRRPSVRGVAMNPVDHPHGGGGIARASVTPWGKPTKGHPTSRSKRRIEIKG